MDNDPKSVDDEAPETIAAIATAAGRAGIGIVRISGPRCLAICVEICGRPIVPRVATLCRFRGSDGSCIDEGIALYFPAPHSYTGEDVLELQGHGGSVVLQLVLERVLRCGAQRARPGEFTQRAFLNGRMDLTQAEAVADLIDAVSVQAARAAQRSLGGAFSQRVDAMSQQLSELRMHIEAALDFADEDIDLPADDALQRRSKQLVERIDKAIAAAHAGRKLNDAISVVIAGAPNVGKSSLLNALVGSQRAIVTDVPGTTRDVILEQVVIQGLALQLCDTAGLRHSDDVVEQAGVALTRERLGSADIVVLVADASDPKHSFSGVDSCLLPALSEHVHQLRVRNKIDLSGEAGGESENGIRLSALTGEGMSMLKSALARVARKLGREGEFTARQRHLDCLWAARTRADAAHRLILDAHGTELVAEELRLAQLHLSELTGRVTSDEILGRIFASFCIGK